MSTSQETADPPPSAERTRHLRCPHCRSVFRAPATMAVDRVRCGSCAGVFTVADHWLDGPLPDLAPMVDEDGGRQASPQANAPPLARDSRLPVAPPAPDFDEAEALLDLSEEATDYFLEQAFGQGSSSEYASENDAGHGAQFAEGAFRERALLSPIATPDVEGLEETVVLDHSDAAGDAFDALAEDRPGVEAADTRPPGWDQEILSALPDADATLALNDPLLRNAEDSVDSIDLSQLDPATEDGRSAAYYFEDELASLDDESPGLEETVRMTSPADIAPTAGDEAADFPGDPGEEIIDLIPSWSDEATLELPVPDLLARNPAEADPGSLGLTEPIEPPTTELPRAKPSLAGFLATSVAGLVLVVLLTAQVLYFMRQDLQADPLYRPYLIQLCGLVGCEVAAPRDLGQILVSSRHVVSHPRYKGALMLDATLVNKAPFAQAYPKLLLRFSDQQGEPHAERVFTPAEYLQGPLVDPDNFVSEVPVQVRLELLDPGPAAVRYDLDPL